jgi:hypothetical protein
MEAQPQAVLAVPVITALAAVAAAGALRGRLLALAAQAARVLKIR